MKDSDDYKSPLTGWYEESGVRSGDRRILTPDNDLSDIYYPPDLAPVTSHPIIRALGNVVIKRLLVRHLYVYLDTIERLEHEIVNKVTFNVARRNIGIHVPTNMRLDAFKIYADEAYHMLYSADLNEQIIDTTKIAPILSVPSYSMFIDSLSEKVGQSYRDLILTLLSVITETMISSILLDIPKDKRVVATVRDLIRDHAEDEGRHSKFFTLLFERFWPTLSMEEKSLMGPILPQLIFNFSKPNFDAILKILLAEGLSRDTAIGIIRESYPQKDLIQAASNAAQVTIRLFERMGVLEDTKVADEFEKILLWQKR